MSKDRPTHLYFNGGYDATGQPLEFFGGMPGEYDPIPARDLGPDDTALLTGVQWKVLDSDTGKRLYHRTEPKDGTAAKPDTASATTPPE